MTNNSKYTIMCYNISSDMLMLFEDTSKAITSLEIISTDSLSDILAIQSNIVVADLSSENDSLTKDFLSIVADMVSAGDMTQYILLGSLSNPTPQKLKPNCLSLPSQLSEETLRLFLLKQFSQQQTKKRTEKKYDKKLFRLFGTLKKLKEQSIVTIEELAEDFNVSPRTVRRDIQMLNTLGEWIEYDTFVQGYRLEDSQFDNGYI